MTMTMTTPAPPEPGNTLDQLKTRIDGIIRTSINQQPRSLQKRIGPSEIGDPCDRWILHKLAGHEEPPRPTIAWKPFIGTAVHATLEKIFNQENNNNSDDWVTEQQVTVGYLPNGEPITGHADLFHTPTGTVIDWKIVGDKQLANYRVNGPSQRYRVQAHTYAGGFMLNPDPVTVRNVAIYFLPRDREFEKGHMWCEPWNPAIWSDAIQRVGRLWREFDQHGMPDAAASKPVCDSRFCHWCQQVKHDTANSERRSLFTEYPPF